MAADASAVFSLTGLVMGAFNAFTPSLDSVRNAPGRMSETGVHLRGGQFVAVGFALSVAGMAVWLTKDWTLLFLAAVLIIMFVFVQENALRQMPPAEVAA